MTLYRLTISDQDLAKLEHEQTKRKKKKQIQKIRGLFWRQRMIVGV